MGRHVTTLTADDRRILAWIEATYGVPKRELVGDTARAQVVRRARRPSLVRTISLVLLAIALIAGTDPGRTIYGALGDEVSDLHDALSAALAAQQ